MGFSAHQYTLSSFTGEGDNTCQKSCDIVSDCGQAVGRPDLHR